MSHIPRLYTPRLCLRPLSLADASRIQHLAGDPRIAATTARVPHPYTLPVAEKLIASHDPNAALGTEFVFAITLPGTRTPGRERDPNDTGFLIGVIEIGIDQDPDQRRGTLGYWIGVPFWNKGFATEAARAMLAFGFSRRHLHRIDARHLALNPASGRVMEKVGMTREGLLRAHFFKQGEYHDIVQYGILHEEWQRATRPRKLIAPRRNAELQPT